MANSDEDLSSYPANPSNLVDRRSSPESEVAAMHTLFTANTDAYWPRAVAAAAAGPYASGLPANLTNCYSAAYDQVLDLLRRLKTVKFNLFQRVFNVFLGVFEQSQ